MRGAAVEYERALALSLGNALVLRMSASFLSRMGRIEAALAYAQRVVVLDPLNVSSHRALGGVLYDARRYREAIEGVQPGTDSPIDMRVRSRQVGDSRTCRWGSSRPRGILRHATPGLVQQLLFGDRLPQAQSAVRR